MLISFSALHDSRQPGIGDEIIEERVVLAACSACCDEAVEASPSQTDAISALNWSMNALDFLHKLLNLHSHLTF